MVAEARNRQQLQMRRIDAERSKMLDKPIFGARRQQRAHQHHIGNRTDQRLERGLGGFHHHELASDPALKGLLQDAPLFRVGLDREHARICRGEAM